MERKGVAQSRAKPGRPLPTAAQSPGVCRHPLLLDPPFPTSRSSHPRWSAYPQTVLTHGSRGPQSRVCERAVLKWPQAAVRAPQPHHSAQQSLDLLTIAH